MSDDGGQAFPTDSSVYREGFPGMTLRDYFAAAAMTGVVSMLTREEMLWLADGTKGGAPQARIAYALADAMLKARAAK